MRKELNNRKKRKTFRKRNYAAEYQRRILKGQSEGKSKSAARGHPRAGETPKSGRAVQVDLSHRLERAAQLMRSGQSLRGSAKALHISEERVRRYVKETTSVKRIGRRWLFDQAMAIASNGKVRWIIVSSPVASELGRYWQAVSVYLDDDNESALSRFVGHGVRDVNGKFWPLETGLRTLDKLDAIGELTGLELYRNTPSED